MKRRSSREWRTAMYCVRNIDLNRADTYERDKRKAAKLDKLPPLSEAEMDKVIDEREETA